MQHQIAANQTGLGLHTLGNGSSLFLSLLLCIPKQLVCLLLIAAENLLGFDLCLGDFLVSLSLSVLRNLLDNAFNVVQPVSPRFQSFCFTAVL